MHARHSVFIQQILAAVLVIVFTLVTSANGQSDVPILTLTPTGVRSRVETPTKQEILADDISIQISITPRMTTDSRKVVDIAMTGRCRDFWYEAIADRWETTIGFYFRFRAANGTLDGYAQGTERILATTEELRDVSKCKPVTIRRSIFLPAGTYRIDSVIRDVRTGKKNITALAFTL